MVSDELTQSEREQVSALIQAANELEFVYLQWNKTREEKNQLWREVRRLRERLSMIDKAVRGEE